MEVTQEVIVTAKCPCCSHEFEWTQEVTVEVEPEDIRGDLD